MIKRPSQKITDEQVARATAMRRAGKTHREIADELDLSVSTIHAAVKAVPVGDAPAAVTADDAEFGGDSDMLAREALQAGREMLASLRLRNQIEVDRAKAARASGGRMPKRTVTARDLTAAKAMMVEARKLALLARGQATSRTETIHRGEPEPTPEEKSEMDRLNRLAGIQ